MSDDPTPPRNVTIRCKTCGREIWQEAGDWITLEQMRQAECSDCLIQRLKLPAPPAAHPETPK